MKPGTRIFAIDPGPESSGCVLFVSGEPGELIEHHADMDNTLLQNSLLAGETPAGQLLSRDIYGAIEVVASFQLRAKAELFRTAMWAGRLSLAWERGAWHPIGELTISDVSLCLCDRRAAKQADIALAIWHRFGGSREKAVGTNKAPGPLHGLKSHAVSALAVALTWAQTHVIVGEQPNGK